MIVEGGVVVAVDLLPFENVEGAICLYPLDVRNYEDRVKVKKCLQENDGGAREANVILSDMAPNVSGVNFVDHENSMVGAWMHWNWIFIIHLDTPCSNFANPFWILPRNFR